MGHKNGDILVDELHPIDKFNFLLGKWKMEYIIPESQFSKEDKGQGQGEFNRILNNRYVTFDYKAQFSKSEGAAHGIFAWDDKNKIFRYWWFEDSGAYDQAKCDFINQNTLCLNWHNSILVQTFSKTGDDKIILEMRYPINKTDYKVVLRVVFSKK